jgi:hypothetical protein
VCQVFDEKVGKVSEMHVLIMIHILLLMSNADLIINKSRRLLDRLDKVAVFDQDILLKFGVGVEGGASADHQSGGFGYTDETIPDDDSFYFPEDINSEDNCRQNGKRCLVNHDEKITTRQAFSTGETAQASIDQKS